MKAYCTLGTGFLLEVKKKNIYLECIFCINVSIRINIRINVSELALIRCGMEIQCRCQVIERRKNQIPNKICYISYMDYNQWGMNLVELGTNILFMWLNGSTRYRKTIVVQSVVLLYFSESGVSSVEKLNIIRWALKQFLGICTDGLAIECSRF